MHSMTTEPIYQPPVYRGKVQWFHKHRGIGFIAVGAVCDCPCHKGFNGITYPSCVRCESRHAEDVFVHYSHIDMPGFKLLLHDQLVEFELIDALRKDKKVQAHNVRVVRG